MTESEEKTLDAIISSWNELDEMAMTELANGNDNFKLSVGPWTVKLQLEEDKAEKNPNCYDPDLSEDEQRLRDELKIFLYEELYMFSYCHDAPDVVYVNVYDVLDGECRKLKDNIQAIIDKYDEDKLTSSYIPHVVSHAKTLKYYPDLTVDY